MGSLPKSQSLGTLCLILAAFYAAEASYNIGVGIADTTGPVAEVVFVSSFIEIIKISDPNPISPYLKMSRCN